jgi:hypothetical protein
MNTSKASLLGGVIPLHLNVAKFKKNRLKDPDKKIKLRQICLFFPLQKGAKILSNKNLLRRRFLWRKIHINQ